MLAPIHRLINDHDIVVTRLHGHHAGGTPLPNASSVTALCPPFGGRIWTLFVLLAQMPINLPRLVSKIRRADIIYVLCPGEIQLYAIPLVLLSRKRAIFRYGASWNHRHPFVRYTRWLLTHWTDQRHIIIIVGEGESVPKPNCYHLFATAQSADEVHRIQLRIPDRTERQDPLRAICVGRLSREKGVGVLISSIEDLRNRLREANQDEKLPHLTIIGDGPLRASLEQVVNRKGLGRYITFLGQLPQEEVVTHLLSSDVFLQASFTEGYPKARLEALTCGLPVITTEVGFAKEMCGRPGERGWVVPIGESREMARILESVLLDSTLDWPAMRQRCQVYGRQRTTEEFGREIASICKAQWGERCFEETNNEFSLSA